MEVHVSDIYACLAAVAVHMTTVIIIRHTGFPPGCRLKASILNKFVKGMSR